MLSSATAHHGPLPTVGVTRMYLAFVAAHRRVVVVAPGPRATSVQFVLLVDTCTKIPVGQSFGYIAGMVRLIPVVTLDSFISTVSH